MKHFASSEFWSNYDALPVSIRRIADRNFEQLKADPRHPSLHFKRIGRLWSVRVGLNYRALGTDTDDAVVWFWIGSHADYDKLIAT